MPKFTNSIYLSCFFVLPGMLIKTTPDTDWKLPEFIFTHKNKLDSSKVNSMKLTITSIQLLGIVSTLLLGVTLGVSRSINLIILQVTIVFKMMLSSLLTNDCNIKFHPNHQSLIFRRSRTNVV